MATEAYPFVVMVAAEKTQQQRIKYAVGIYRRLKPFITIKPVAIKRLKA